MVGVANSVSEAAKATTEGAEVCDHCGHIWRAGFTMGPRNIGITT